MRHVHPWTSINKKLAIAQLQSFSKGKTYVSLVVSTNLSKTMFENNSQERNYTQGHNCNIKHLNHTPPQIAKANDFSLL
jgi:hypothetical protein